MTHHRQSIPRWSALCSILVLLACQPKDDDDAADTATDGGSESESETEGGGDPDVLVGSFQLQLAEPDTSSLIGKVYDGETPKTLVWELAMQAGGCRLSTPRVPFCSTPCGGSAACVEDETCQDYPSAVSVGDVLVTGVATTDGETSFTMTPIADNYQPPAGITLAYPAFAEGDMVTLAAEGDMLAGFELSATGVAPLQLDAGELVLDPSTDLQLSWTAADATSDSVVAVKLDISHHAGTKGMIECEVEDSGSLAIPAALVSALLDLGVAGFPTIIVTRTSTGSVVTSAGRVDLVLSSQLERTVIIDGLVSCTDDSQCPPGQTCQPDLHCQ